MIMEKHVDNFIDRADQRTVTAAETKARTVSQVSFHDL